MHADSQPVAIPTAEREETVVDLEAIARDLDAAQTALQRLADGTYWSDEATGAPIPDHVLDADPIARHAR